MIRRLRTTAAKIIMPHDSDPEIDYSIFDTGEMRQMVRDKKNAVEYPDPWYKQEKPKAYFAAAGVIFVLYMILF